MCFCGVCTWFDLHTRIGAVLITERASLVCYALLTSRPFRAAQYPVTATQWHPEKNAFEWARDLDIPHDKGAIAVTQAVANFVVDEVGREGAIGLHTLTITVA